jgi:hypothetical protein
MEILSIPPGTEQRLMPSPFPGMDPYLESPAIWRDVHHALLEVIRQQLAGALRPRYVVRLEERVYLADPVEIGRRLGLRIPDITLLESETPRRFRHEDSGGVAVETAEPVVLTTCLEEETREAYLVVTERETRRAITIIEVVSPTNKLANSPGRESFLHKRSEVLKSTTHWVEIDLLREGESLSARSLILRPFEYLVHVSPVAMRPEGKVWPIRLMQRLPVIGIPLKPEDPDAQLDLQAVLDLTYDRAGYADQIDYTADPEPPLSPELASWTDRHLRKAGLRPAPPPA